MSAKFGEPSSPGFGQINNSVKQPTSQLNEIKAPMISSDTESSDEALSVSKPPNLMRDPNMGPMHMSMGNPHQWNNN